MDRCHGSDQSGTTARHDVHGRRHFNPRSNAIPCESRKREKVNGEADHIIDTRVADWRLWGGFVFGSALCWGMGAAHAAVTPLNGAWREVRPSDTPQSVLDEYRAGTAEKFRPLPAATLSAQRRPGSWVVIAPQPPWDNTRARPHHLSRRRWAPSRSSPTAKSDSLALDDFSYAACTAMAGWPGGFRATLPASAPILLKIRTLDDH